MQKYVATHGIEDTNALIDYAYALATKYGEGAAELACQMYDAIAEVQNVLVPAAEPAATATMHETAKSVMGSLKQSQTGALLEGVTQRLVKQASADTTLQNAKRDGAQFAWVTFGDTCAYCRMLSAIGWQTAGKTTLNGKHAEHIHGHCDCQYMVDFKGNLEIPGYDPYKMQSEIEEAYNNEESFDDLLNFMWDSSTGKRSNAYINDLRRQIDSKRRDEINAQKRIAYKARKDAEE